MLFDMTANTNARKVMILNASLPKDLTVKATDGTAVFSVAVSEDGRPNKYTYQWYVDGTAVSGATSATYTRNGSGDKGQHTVWCEVTNKAGTVRSREAKLTVNRIPVLNTSYPANATVVAKNSVTVKVAIATAGYPDTYTYQWYKDGSAVSGATGSTYSFTPTAAGTTKVYCKVTHAAGSVNSRTATITATNVYLFNAGDQCTDVTGGWICDNTSKTGEDAGAPTMTIKDVMNIHRDKSSSKKRGSVYPKKNYIDFSKYTTLRVITTTQAAQGECMVNITSKSGSGYESGVITNYNLAGRAAGTYNIDVSKVNKSAYLYISTVASSERSVDCSIKSIVLIP